MTTITAFLREEADMDEDCDHLYSAIMHRKAADEIERLQGIIDRLPEFVDMVASDCGAKHEDSPSLYKRGGVWRYHVVRAGNDWEDDSDPIEAARLARKR